MTYKPRHIEDLLNNESFREWILNPESTEKEYWEEWIRQHPEEQEKVIQAEKMLRALQPLEKGATQRTQADVWRRIHQHEQPEVPLQIGRPGRYLYRAAAILLPLLAAALVTWWLQSSQKVSISTAYGEVTEVQLPDGSWLTLNANSTLSYDPEWSDPQNREVWLEGEALFRVKKNLLTTDSLLAYAKFTVHTEKLDVEVLGTTFSVNHREQETKVILTEGRVKVVTAATDDEDVILQEGEMISYINNQLLISQVDTEAQHSWKDELVIFKDTPLDEIFRRLENTYGYRIVIDKNSSLPERRFSGSFPRDSVEVLLDKLSKLYRTDIKIQDKEIMITE